jgi:hypothetical protein
MSKRKQFNLRQAQKKSYYWNFNYNMAEKMLNPLRKLVKDFKDPNGVTGYSFNIFESLRPELEEKFNLTQEQFENFETTEEMEKYILERWHGILDKILWSVEQMALGKDDVLLNDEYYVPNPDYDPTLPEREEIRLPDGMVQVKLNLKETVDREKVQERHKQLLEGFELMGRYWYDLDW